MTDFTQRVFSDANQRPVPYDGSPVAWRISAYVIVVKDGQLLTVKNKREELRDVPGGGIEPGETIEEAVAREAMEEAGVKVTLGSIVWVNQDWFYHREGRFYQAIQLFYTAELKSELITPTDPDMEAIRWLPLGQVAESSLPTFVKEAVTAFLQNSYKKA